MSAISAKTEFTFDNSAAYSQTLPVTYGVTPESRGLTSRLSAAIQWLAEMPRRRAVINELGSLSDHELADIGLSRAELPRVFDRDFAGARRI